MVIIVVIIVFGILGAAIASGKNRNALGWGLLCALFPLIGLIVLLFMSKLEDEKFELAKRQFELQMQQMQQGKSLSSDDTIDCPNCAETIKAKAKVCRFCQHELEAESET